jgi:uracil-DNA glycosylase
MPKPSQQQPSLFDEPAVEVPPPPPVALPPGFPADWGAALAGEFSQPYFAKLQAFVSAERVSQDIFPAEADTYNAFRYTPLSSVRVVILGQDPYPTPGQGHGLCFSVRPGVKLPGSLRNIYQEMQSDLGISPAKHGYLLSWAKQGILLLNAVLTVRSGKPASHANQGWETFTDAALKVLSAGPKPIVFLLWGAYAQKKAILIDTQKHTILKSAHPSPLSAANGFFGSQPFSKINAALTKTGSVPIDWKLPAVAIEE